jgi:hypothetical protein
LQEAYEKGDETLTIKKNQSTQKRKNTRNKMKGLTSKKTNERPKRANHKGNTKFPNPLLLQETYQIRKGDKTLPIINKPKHQEKGEYKEQNERTHVQEDK